MLTPKVWFSMVASRALPPPTGGVKRTAPPITPQRAVVVGQTPTPKSPVAPPPAPPAQFETVAQPRAREDLTPVAQGKLAAGGTLMGLRMTEVAGRATAGVSPKTPVYGTPAFEEVLDAATHSVARSDNKVTVLFDGVNSFAERNRMIDGAKSSINLQTFIFTDDDTGWDLARRLAGKAQEGVKVRVIYDALGSNRSDSKIFDFMKKAGVEVRPYGDPLKQFWDINDRWHEKHLIVDGQASVEGGMNIANEYAFGGSGRQIVSRGQQGAEPWRDVDIKVEGKAVHDAQRCFLLNWAELGEPVAQTEHAALFPEPKVTPGGPKVRVVHHRPDEEGDQNTNALYLKAIQSAQKSITIENAYFLPPKELREALMDAARRGVDVQVMTNSKASNDLGFVSDAARYFFDDLLAAGVKIHEKQGGTLHSKTATFDGSFSLVGSCNLNGRSKGRDSEVVMAIEDSHTARQLNRRFATGLGQTQQVTEKELQAEGFLTNLKQWALSTMAWTF